MNRPKFTNELQTTGFPFEIKVAEELEKAKWKFLIDYPVSVLPDASNLPVEETSIDFKAWQDSLSRARMFGLIETRRAAFHEWVLFRKIKGNSFFVLSHHEDSERRTGFQFHLRRCIRSDRSWIHCQSLVRFQTDRGVYSNVVPINGKGHCIAPKKDQPLRKGEIRKGAIQASIATIGAINDDYAFMEKAHGNVVPPGKGRLYLPIIATAAKISIMDFSSDQIDENGLFLEPDNITRKEVPWAIYRFSLCRSLWLPIFDPLNAVYDLYLRDKHRKLDIFLVNVKHLGEFFEEMKGIVE